MQKQDNPDLKKAKRWLDKNFSYSPQREAQQYFKQYPDGQVLEDFQRVSANTARHCGKGRNFFGTITLLSALGLGVAASDGDVDKGALFAPIAAVFGALALRDQRRHMLWQWVHAETAAHGLEHGQQRLRACQRGEFERRPKV